VKRFRIITSTIETIEVEAENMVDAKVSVIMGNIKEDCVKNREVEILKAKVLKG